MNDTLMSTCIDHLRHEEVLLQGGLSIVNDIQNAFCQRGLTAFAAVFGRHAELLNMMDDLQHRRRQFSQTASHQLGEPPGDITYSAVLKRLPGDCPGVDLANAVQRVQRLAQELTTANFVVSVHVRVHLDAFRAILRDMTNTKSGSGRYGPAGQAEALDYGPMLQING